MWDTVNFSFFDNDLAALYLSLVHRDKHQCIITCGASVPVSKNNYSYNAFMPTNNHLVQVLAAGTQYSCADFHRVQDTQNNYSLKKIKL